MRRRVVLSPTLDPLEELLGATLLKQAHQGTPDGLHLGGGDLGDAPVAVDVRARDLTELEVASDVRVDEDVGHLAVGHEELGDQVHRVVTVATEGGGRLLVPELTVQLGEVEGGRLGAVVVVPVHVQHLLALHREQAREDTLRQTRAEDDLPPSAPSERGPRTKS